MAVTLGYIDAAGTFIMVTPATPLPTSAAAGASVGPTSIAKAEDAPALDGDTGIASLSVRAPTVPAAATSAAGDYGYTMIDPQGKQVVKVGAPAEDSWQSSQAIIVATDVVGKAAAAAGLRNYVTDIAFSNSSAAAVLVTVKDGATIIFQAWIGAGLTLTFDFVTPLRGTAATAINIQVGTATTTLYASLAGYVGI